MHAHRALRRARRHDEIQRLADQIAENRAHCPNAERLAEWLYAAARRAMGTTRHLIDAMGWDVEDRAGKHGIDLTDEQAAQWKALAEALCTRGVRDGE